MLVFVVGLEIVLIFVVPSGFSLVYFVPLRRVEVIAVVVLLWGGIVTEMTPLIIVYVWGRICLPIAVVYPLLIQI